MAPSEFGARHVDDLARYRWLARHVLPHEVEIRSWILRYVRTLSRADADDLVQEAYARIWALDFAVITNGRAYFYAIVRNLALEQARRARIVPMERMGEIDALRIPSDEPGPERQVGARQEVERLRRILAVLPAKCRQAFELRKIMGLTGRETAKLMGVREGTVEKHLARAFARILDAMGEAEPEAGERENSSHDRSGSQHD